MYYIFHGKDTIKSRKKVSETISAFSKKNPHSNIFRFSDEDFDTSSFLGYSGSLSLFSDKFLIVCENLFKNKESAEVVSSNIEEIKNSPNVFIFLEESLKKTELSLLEEKAEKIFKFELSSDEDKGAKEKAFNIFTISDAFGEKNKKKIWIVYNQAIKEGVSSEEAFWKIVWQVKNMLLAGIASEKGDRAIEKLKINPFVLSKAKRYSKNFDKEELKDIYWKLVSFYHESRNGNVDFDIALERFILEL